jgi:hypothetical protein
VLIWAFSRIRGYHEALDRLTDMRGPVNFSPLLPPVVVIPMKRLDHVARKALRLAMSLSTEVRAVQIVAEDLRADDLSECWDELVERPAQAAGLKPPYLKDVYSPYRDFFDPFLRAVEELGDEYPGRTLAVMIPEMVDRRWWHFLFRHRATFLKALLLLRTGPRISVISVPWYADGPADQGGPRG